MKGWLLIFQLFDYFSTVINSPSLVKFRMIGMLKSITLFFIAICAISSFGQTKKVEITYKRNSDNSVTFSYKKTSPGSSFVIINFDQLSNTTDEKEIRKTIKGFTGNLTTLKPIDENQGISFSYSYASIKGDYKATPEHDFKYVLPFKKGKTIKALDLNYLGKKFGNKAPKNWRSFQFLTKPNDTVFASRKGVVVQLQNELNPDAVKEYGFRSNSNYVIIEHSDGTFAKYDVLKKNSVMVKLGQKIYPSMPLAITGSYDKPENSQLRFSIYYLDKDILDYDENHKETLANQKHYYASVDPLFYVNDVESIKLISRNNYTSIYNNAIIEYEMTKREKKKRKKKD